MRHSVVHKSHAFSKAHYETHHRKMSVLTMPLFLVSIACAQAFTYNQSFDALPTSGAATDITGTGAVTNQGALVAISTTGAAWQAARILGSGTTAVKLNVDTGS